MNKFLLCKYFFNILFIHALHERWGNARWVMFEVRQR